MWRGVTILTLKHSSHEPASTHVLTLGVSNNGDGATETFDHHQDIYTDIERSDGRMWTDPVSGEKFELAIFRVADGKVRCQ